MSAHFIQFGLAGAYINPDNVYKIDRVTDTVTFTLVLSGMGAGTIFTEDFVFGSELDAIDALAEFIVATLKGQLTLAEAVGTITAGWLSNPQMTKNTFQNPKLGSSADRIEILNKATLNLARELVLQFEAETT